MTASYAARHYTSRAPDYVASTVHSQGPDLDAIEAMVIARHPQRILDIGCGGGHVTYRVAPHVRQVTACDVTETMTAAVAEQAVLLGHDNVETCVTPAEALSFDDGMFDAVICRFTTHHWSDAARGLREARRVLKRDGFGIFVDVVSPANALCDTWLQSAELLRDIAHVRNYTVAEWTHLLGQAGFATTGFATHRLRMQFESWVARTQTPEIRIAAIRSLLHSPPEAVTRHFAIEPDGSFTLDVALFQVEPA